ncbi:MAG: hypothetical protein Kow0025_19600 [Thermodesulfovibrionales bacterium]
MLPHQVTQVVSNSCISGLLRLNSTTFSRLSKGPADEFVPGGDQKRAEAMPDSQARGADRLETPVAQ